jgi:hypothetical protein
MTNPLYIFLPVHVKGALQTASRQRGLQRPQQGQGRSKVVAAFGRKPLNFRITSGLEATLEQPCSRGIRSASG